MCVIKKHLTWARNLTIQGSSFSPAARIRETKGRAVKFLDAAQQACAYHSQYVAIKDRCDHDLGFRAPGSRRNKAAGPKPLERWQAVFDGADSATNDLRRVDAMRKTAESPPQNCAGVMLFGSVSV